MSSTDIDLENEHQGGGCLRRRLGLKRKHSEMEEDFKSNGNKSIFTSLKEKLGFKKLTQARDDRKEKKSFFSPLRDLNRSGEHDNGFSSFASTPLGANHSSKAHTNINLEEIPRKRVKFDEENLIVSSITYQRQNALREPQKEESLLTKFINFTANLF